MSDENTVDPQAPAEQAKPAPGPGHNFCVYAPVEVPLADVRRSIRDKFGLDGHIRVKVGPFILREGSLDAEAVPVDDEFLMGDVTFDLGKMFFGWCVYVGVLKAPDDSGQTAGETID